MNDLVWFIIICIIFELLGILFIILGLQIWIKQKMNLIISHHCDKVSEADKKAYCTLFGVGILIMGIGFILSGVLSLIIQSLLALVPMAVGIVIGIASVISAVAKYNR